MVTKDTHGKETTYTFKYLYFNTSYTFDVMARFSKDGRVGKGVTVVKTTGPFSASVGPLQKKIQDNTVILSWSAPRTIDLNKNLRVNVVRVNIVQLDRSVISMYLLTLLCLRSIRHRHI